MQAVKIYRSVIKKVFYSIAAAKPPVRSFALAYTHAAHIMASASL
jgi:hypothetical protein